MPGRANFEPYDDEGEKYIFISYSHADKDVVFPIIERLNAEGFRIWYDSCINFGSNWRSKIEEKIKGCSAFISFQSKSYSHKSVYCSQEIYHADSNDKNILYIFLEKLKEKEITEGIRHPHNETQSAFLYQYYENDKLGEFFDALINAELIQTCRSSERKAENITACTDALRRGFEAKREKRIKKYAGIAAALVAFAGALLFCGYQYASHTLLNPAKNVMPGQWDIFGLASNGTPETISPDRAGIFRLASEGTPEKIQLAINSGVNFDVMSDDSETPFMKSVLHNPHKESVRLLIHQLNRITKQGQLDTAMQKASAEASNLDIIKLLAEEGADFQKGSRDTDKPLFMAAMYNPNPEITRFFLEAESTADQKFFLSGTFAAHLLSVAATANASNPGVAQYLINAGIDVDAQDEDGVTALMSSAFAGYSPEMIQILLEGGADPDIQDNTGKTALIYSAGRSVWKIAETLIDGGADVDIADNDGKTALIYAAEKFGVKEAKRKIIARLINARANIHIWDNSGKTAFDYAAMNDAVKDDADILRMLNPFYARNSDDVSAGRRIPDHDLTVFNMASRASLAEIKRAVFLGLNFNISNDYGATPLHYAARKNQNPEVIKFLSEQGIDINAENKQGDTPLVYAVRSNSNPEIVKTLVELGAYKDYPDMVIFSMPFRSLEAFKFLFNSEDSGTRELLLKGYLRDKYGRTLLQCAFYNGLDFLKFLLEAGADTEQRDDDGNTVLMRRHYYENVLAKKALLDAGANVNARNFYGQTALMSSAGLAGEAELLLRHKAEVNAQDNSGKTALMYAAEWHNDMWKNLSGEEINEIMKSNPSYFSARSIRLLLNAGADINIQNKAGKRAVDFIDRNLLLKFNPLLIPLLDPESQKP